MQIGITTLLARLKQSVASAKVRNAPTTSQSTKTEQILTDMDRTSPLS